MIVAPAGYGKTHLIAEAVVTFSKERELILTHTHAGVSSIKRKILYLNASKRNFHVETIDGFILRYVLNYPKTSQWTGSIDEIDWEKVRKCGIDIFKKDFIKKVIKNSYAGLYVDEYQDCCPEQHAIILELASILPARVLGDPLQGIFDFGSNVIVDWDNDVKKIFKEVATLNKPWRWERINNSDLGNWLGSVRSNLLSKQPISLNNLPNCVRLIAGSTQANKINACCSILSSINKEESVVIIGMADQVQPMHYVASRLKGRYGVIEPIDSKDLRKFVSGFENSCSFKKAASALDFGCSCFSGINKSVLKNEYTALGKRSLPTRRQPLPISDALSQVLSKNDILSLIKLLESFPNMNNAYLFRKELYYEMLRILREGLRTGSPLKEIMINVRENTRRIGRKLYSRVIARTVLIKGLEFDHAIILDAHLFDHKNLYVALTRASKTVTIISNTNCLLS